MKYFFIGFFRSKVNLACNRHGVCATVPNINSIRSKLTLLLLFLLLTTSSMATPQVTEQNVLLSTDETGADFARFQCIQVQDQLSDKLRSACDEMLESRIRGEQLTAEALQEQAVFSTSHLRLALERQARQSLWLFFLAIGLVLIGSIAAIVQFYRSIKAPDPGSAELAVSTTEFKIKTNWMGILLLGMSMMLLALYLIFVYPIKPTI